MSLFLLLNPKQYTTAPIVLDQSDVWYPERKQWRKQTQLKSKELLTKHLQGELQEAARTVTAKEALRNMQAYGYSNIGKYHKRIVDQLLLAILLNDDD